MPTTNDELSTSETSNARHFLDMCEKFFSILVSYMAAWRMQRKHAEEDVNSLAVQILEQWYSKAAVTYASGVIGETQEVGKFVFNFMYENLQYLEGPIKDKLATDIAQRQAMCSESAQLGVLNERVSQPLSKKTEVDAFLTAYKETFHVQKTSEFLEKLGNSRAKLWDYMIAVCMSGSIQSHMMDSSEELLCKLSTDHSLILSLGFDKADESSDAHSFSKFVRQVAAVNAAHGQYHEALVAGKDRKSKHALLVQLRDSVITLKHMFVLVIHNPDLAIRHAKLLAECKSMIAPNGAVGRVLRNDGTAFLKLFREGLVDREERVSKTVGGTQDGSIWSTAAHDMWEDPDQLMSHYNATLGTMQGPEVEAQVDALVTDRIFFHFLKFLPL